jgi:hypothetical protein
MHQAKWIRRRFASAEYWRLHVGREMGRRAKGLDPQDPLRLQRHDDIWNWVATRQLSRNYGFSAGPIVHSLTAGRQLRSVKKYRQWQMYGIGMAGED